MGVILGMSYSASPISEQNELQVKVHYILNISPSFPSLCLSHTYTLLNKQFQMMLVVLPRLKTKDDYIKWDL